jgi:hypothetical protein
MFALSLEGFRRRPTLPHQSGTPRQNRPTRASHSTYHFRQSTPFFSHYYALFCTAQNHNSFRFIFLRTLCTKHPGWVPVAQDEFIPIRSGACALPVAIVLLYPFVVILDAASSISPAFATLTKNTRGGGAPFTPKACSRFSATSSLATRLPRASRGHAPLNPLDATLTEKPGVGCRISAITPRKEPDQKTERA